MDEFNYSKSLDELFDIALWLLVLIELMLIDANSK